MNKNSKKAYLLLANGVLFEGKAMGIEGETIGELVFTTGMTAYQETLTDPSYYGQIVTQTFPLIGNYGINSEDYESDFVHLNGYIVREHCELPSNFRCEDNINSFLTKNKVVGIYDIDTRCLTRILRENGSMNGMITSNEILDTAVALKKINEFKIENSLNAVSCKEKSFLPALSARKYSVALLDFGHKKDIVNALRNRGCDITVLPYNITASEIKTLAPDAIVLSDGPGDPSQNLDVIKNLTDMLSLKIPTLGIGLGHQLLALANGAKTEKLKHGHRGANQPVIDLEMNRTYITSQNHGYAVITNTLDKNIGEVSHINANDNSCEGFVYKNSPALSVQFHLDTKGGPQDTSYLYDRFLSQINTNPN